jgi:hypothetical protein
MPGGKENSAERIKELEERVKLAELKAREAEASVRFLEAQVKMRNLRMGKKEVVSEKSAARAKSPRQKKHSSALALEADYTVILPASSRN